jgi:general secretion pathway protein G
MRSNGYASKNGFTIVELLIVIVVIAILATISMVAYNGIQDRAKAATAVSDLKTITNAIGIYYADNGAYPCFDHLWDDADERSWALSYISKWPRNPWGGYYHWEHSTGGQTYSISIQSPGQEGAQKIDEAADDGVLTTGLVRGSSTRLEYGVFDQSIPFSDCHI